VRREEGGGRRGCHSERSERADAQIRVPAPSGRPAGSLQGDIMLLLAPHFSLLTPHFSLLTSHSLLLTPYFSLLTSHSLLLTPYCLLLTAYCSLQLSRLPHPGQPLLCLLDERSQRLVGRLPLAQHLAVFLPGLGPPAELLVGRRAEQPHPAEHAPT